MHYKPHHIVWQSSSNLVESSRI